MLLRAKGEARGMRIAICDDEAIFRTYLRGLLVKDSFARGTDIQVAEYADGEALLEAAAAEGPPDVVFLDIRMPGMDGLETAGRLRQRGDRCLIVFLTSLSEYARKGYEVRAFRYLLKEEAERELSRVMEDCRRELGEGAWFSFAQGHQTFRVPTGDILYFESRKRVVLLHTAGESYSFYQKLDALERELEGSGFLRCHRSFLVQERYVRSWMGRSLWLEDGTEVPISRGCEKEVNRRLMLRKGQ